MSLILLTIYYVKANCKRNYTVDMHHQNFYPKRNETLRTNLKILLGGGGVTLFQY